jgi:hypothetical protein
LSLVVFRDGHRSGGFSLAEASLSAFLLAFVLLLTIGAFVPGMKVTKQAEESIASQREVVLAFERLMAEMSLMDRAGVTVGPECLSFLSHEPYWGNNPLLALDEVQRYGYLSRHTAWQKFVILRLRDGRLWRREAPYDGGHALARVRPDRLLGVADVSNRQEKVFAREVEEFIARTVGPSRVQMRIRSVHRGARRPESCDMSFEIVMRGTN